jgi:hypothetical protein
LSVALASLAPSLRTSKFFTARPTSSAYHYYVDFTMAANNPPADETHKLTKPQEILKWGTGKHSSFAPSENL